MDQVLDLEAAQRDSLARLANMSHGLGRRPLAFGRRRCLFGDGFEGAFDDFFGGTAETAGEGGLEKLFAVRGEGDLHGGRISLYFRSIMRKIGTSTGAIFPKEMLAQLKVRQGDTLFTVETPDGVLLTPYDPDVEKQLEAGREFMREYRDTFRSLAK